jgi:hypothetical protein
MKEFNVLVFPCGSEIGLEIHRSLRYSSHVNLIGASSTDDHGKFVYDKYIGGLPFIDDDILPVLKNIVKQQQIDAIYPAMDSVICGLKVNEEELGCKIISSSAETAAICLSKTKTYDRLGNIVRVPRVFGSIKEIDKYPVFIKPEIGYGTRGTFEAECEEDVDCFLKRHKSRRHIICEFLPGEEFTVDCFTNRKGQLLFAGPRRRNRVTNGISVNTSPVKEGRKEFNDFAGELNKNLEFRGAWFFQVKRDEKGNLTLLEVASRLGGSSALYRGQGVNFALLSLLDAFDIDVEVMVNEYEIELDRALDSRFKTSLSYSTIYVDFDDCLVVHNRINAELVMFLYQAINRNKKIVLLTKHDGDLKEALKNYRLTKLFDEIIHIKKDDQKYKHVRDKAGILIDDSFAERKEMAEVLGLPVFSTDMIEIL